MVLVSFTSRASLILRSIARANSLCFGTRVQEARRARFPTSSNTVDGDQSSEEPPD